MAKQRTISEDSQHQELSSLSTPEGGTEAENRPKDVSGEGLPADTSVVKGNKDNSDNTVNLTEGEVDMKKEEDKTLPDTESNSETPMPDENKNPDTDVISESSESAGLSSELLQKEEEK